MAEHEVRVRTWVPDSESAVRTRLLGWISIEYGTLILDSIVLRNTSEGRYALSFPARTDRVGRKLRAPEQPVVDALGWRAASTDVDLERCLRRVRARGANRPGRHHRSVQRTRDQADHRRSIWSMKASGSSRLDRVRQSVRAGVHNRGQHG